MKLKQNLIPLGENDPLNINQIYNHYSPKHYTKSFDLYPRPANTDRKGNEE